MKALKNRLYRGGGGDGEPAETESDEEGRPEPSFEQDEGSEDPPSEDAQ